MINPQMVNPQMIPQGFNWQQEMLNRLGSLQNQIQNSFQPQTQFNQPQFMGLKGKQVGSKEEVLSMPADFDTQYFPFGADTIYTKRLGVDGKSQILEYKLVPESVVQSEENNKKDFDILYQKYNQLSDEFEMFKRELLKPVQQQRKKEQINEQHN